jgi:hypothetical protein
MGTEMSDFQNQPEASENDAADVVASTPFQMHSGAEILAEWSETATPTRRNAVYAALFSMVDRTLFRTHQLVDDYWRPAELFVSIKDDLVLKVRINSFDSFDVIYVGEWEKAPGFEFVRPRP